MKTCTKCQQTKSLEDFAKDKRHSDGCGSWCRVCSRKYLLENYKGERAAYYEKNKEKLNQQAKQRWVEKKDQYSVAKDAYNLANRDRLLPYFRKKSLEHRNFTDSLKAKPCQDCNRSFPPCCMEFDHVRGEKRFALGKMANHRREAVLEELAKCELVCCNCHRIRTQTRKGDSKIPKLVAFHEWLNHWKSSPCTDCGQTYHHAAMDFDHVRGSKVSGVAQMWSWRRERVLGELAKCDLVCANCHRIRTQSQLSRMDSNFIPRRRSRQDRTSV